MEVNIQNKLYKEIVAYCAINHMDVEKYINNILKQKFMVEMYGEKPGIHNKQTKKLVKNEEFPPVFNEKNATIPNLKKPIIEPLNEPIKTGAIEQDDEVVTKPEKQKHRKLT